MVRIYTIVFTDGSYIDRYMELVVRAEAGLSSAAALLDAEADLVKVVYIRILSIDTPYTCRDTGYIRNLCIYAEAGQSPGAALGKVAETAIYNTYRTCPVQTFGDAGTNIGRAQ